jgi:hypothetical protein
MSSNPMGDSMSSNEKKPEEVTTLGDHHAPAPPQLLGDGGATTQGDHHAPVPPKG